MKARIAVVLAVGLVALAAANVSQAHSTYLPYGLQRIVNKGCLGYHTSYRWKTYCDCYTQGVSARLSWNDLMAWEDAGEPKYGRVWNIIMKVAYNCPLP